jgi:predicted nucleotidyltransferase component of viral defense system
MLNINEIIEHYPDHLKSRPFYEYMLKEYFHYKMLDIIFNGNRASQLSFIGGTSLHILHGIARFSEDLDFDCFDLDREEFMQMTDNIIKRIREEGIEIIADDKEKDLKLKAFRRNLVFPGLLFTQNISGHKEQKFLIKIESEPHNFDYVPDKPIIHKFNIFTQVKAAPADILLSMKIGTVLERQKGRDYYDCIFLMGKTKPNYNYLSEKFDIHSPQDLKERILDSCRNVDFKHKAKDFERLTYRREEANKIEMFTSYIEQYDF